MPKHVQIVKTPDFSSLLYTNNDFAQKLQKLKIATARLLHSEALVEKWLGGYTLVLRRGQGFHFYIKWSDMGRGVEKNKN